MLTRVGWGRIPGVLLLLGALLAGHSDVEAQDGLTHERMIQTLRLGAVSPHPDGERVIVQVQRWSYERSGPESEVWLVEANNPANPMVIPLSGENPRDPVWSPDGALIAYVANGEEGGPQLFLRDVATGTDRQLTRIRTGVRMPRFSPDGERVAFLSRVFPGAGSPSASADEIDRRAAEPSTARIYSGFPYRDYGNQWFDGRVDHVHVVGVGGGDPEDLLAGSALADGSGWSGVMEYDWHPVGDALVFAASEDFDEQADRFDTKSIYLLPLNSVGSPMQPELLVDRHTNDRNPVFSPDGRYLAWRSIWCCWGSAGAGDMDDPLSGHASSPDAGPASLPLLQGDTMPSYRLNRIGVRDMETGQVTILMEGWDRPAGAPAWSRSGEELFFTAEDSGYDPIYRIRLADALAGDDPVRLVGPPGAWGVPSPAGSGVFASRQSSTRPPELYLIEPGASEAAASVAWPSSDGSDGVPPSETELGRTIPPGVGGTADQVRRITALNDGILGHIPMREAEEVFWEHGGRQIQGWLVKPADFREDRVYPLFLFPHGGPNNMHSDGFHYRWNAQLFADAGYVVFMPNPAGSTGFGESFAAEIQGEWGGVVWHEIMAGVDHLLATSPWLSEDRMVAASASYGGYLMNWLITQTDRFQAVFTHASIWNFVSMTGASIISHYMLVDYNNRPPWEDFEAFNRYSPHYYAANITTPTYVSHGGMDAGVPDGQGMELYWTLQRLGIESRFIHFPDEGHWILKPANSRVWYQEMLDWMARHLPPTE